MNLFKKLKKAWLIFINYFYYTAKPLSINPISYLRKRSDINGEKNFKRIDNGRLYEIVNDLRVKSDSTGCEYADYLTLYNQVIIQKPKNILELGCGISTCVIAYALKSNYENHNIQSSITTMEESEYYFKNFVDIIPSDLENFIKPIFSPRKTRYFDGMLGCFYEEIPSITGGYDFLFIDAPQTKYPEDEVKCFDADLINLINDKKLANCYIILDQRIGTMWALNKLLPYLNLSYNVIKRHSTTFLNINT